jgi:hypothetical protein
MDYIFRRKLRDYSEDAPMHLWDEIEARRNTGRAIPLWRGQNWLLWLVLFLGTGLAVSQFFSPSSPKSLDSFPVPVQLAAYSPPEHSAPLITGQKSPAAGSSLVKKKSGLLVQP